MKLLFCQWASICEADMEAGMRALHIEVEVLKSQIASVDYDKEYLQKLTDRLMGDNFDAVFSVNFIPIIARACKLFRLPYISWTVDSPLFQLYSETLLYDCNYVYIFDEAMYLEFRDKNPGHIFYLPLAANVDYLDTMIPTKEEEKRFFEPISFVGSLYSEKCKYNGITLTDYVKGYSEGIIEAQLMVYGYNFIQDVLTDEVVAEFKRCAGWYSLGADYEENDRAIVANEYIGVKCSEQERIRALNAIAKECEVALYTLSETNCLQNVRVKGPAHSRLEMPKIFRCSKINLNLTAKTIRTGLSQRVFDILGSGGFLLTNYQSELSYYFDIGKDLVVYESLQDLVEKCKYYIAHEEERCQIAERGYQKVKDYHTFKHRFQIMFSDANFL